MRHGISWHQLVEWQQYYAVAPFGDERADLSAAMSGATIANEIRAIAAGLAGKRLDPIQVNDLMIDTDKANQPKSGKVSSSSRSRSRYKQSSDDRVAANDYYNAWARSLEAKLKDKATTGKPSPGSVRKRRS